MDMSEMELSGDTSEKGELRVEKGAIPYRRATVPLPLSRTISAACVAAFFGHTAGSVVKSLSFIFKSPTTERRHV
jgi:hypothetical protein